MNYSKYYLFFVFYCWNCSCIAQETSIKILLQQLEDKIISADSTARIYRRLTHLYAKERLVPQALAVAQKEVAILELNKQPEQVLAEAYFNLASLYRTAAVYNKSLEFAQQSLAIYVKKLGKEHLESLSIYRFLAQTYYLKEDYKEAEKLVHSTLKSYQKQEKKEVQNIITLQILLGNIQLKKGDYLLSQEAFLYAKDLYNQYSTDLDLEQLAKIYSNLVSLKLEQQAILEALAYCQEIIAIRKKLYHDENHFSLQSTYINVGFCYYKLGEFEKAIQYYRKSLAILHKTYGEQHDLVAFLHNHIGSTFRELQQQDSAQYHLLKSLTIYRAVLGNSSLNSVAPLWELSKLFRQQKDYNKAKITLEKGILIQQLHHGNLHPDLAKMFLDMAYLLKEQQFYSKALHYTYQAYHSNIHYDRPLDKILMLKILEQQLKLSLLLGPRAMTTAFNLLDKIQPIIALVQLDLNSSMDQRNLIQDIRNICEQGIELCYQLHQINPQTIYLQKVFQLIEYNKAVLLSTQLKKYYHHNNDNPSQKNNQLLLQKNIAEIQFLEHQWQQAEHHKDSLKAQELQQQLFALHQGYEQQINQLYQQLQYHRPIELVSLQKQLGEQQYIYNFFYGHEAIYQLNISTNKVLLSKISLDIEQDIKLFSSQLLDLEESKNQLKKTCQNFDQLASKIYQNLVSNSEKNTILIIPDGLLHYLPFEALTSQANRAATGFHQLNYALYQHNISYAYSATSYYYQQFKHLNKSNSQILGFAPDYTQHPYLQELKATVLETSFLEKHFSGAYYYNNKASKTNFLAQAPYFGILHLASHGFADDNQLHQAQLFFTEQQNDSSLNILYPYEIIQQSLNADLVVLSACQTAIGYWQEGEGVMSLARDFMFAGIPSVLTTLWQVNDHSSRLLIQDFYMQLIHSPKNSSLQIAKQNYLKNASALSAHPYFWAGYIVLGNTDRIDIHARSSINFRYIGFLFFVFCIIILYLGQKRLFSKKL